MSMRNAFTLIELMVVVSIMTTIASLSVGVLSTAKNQAKITNTRSILMKVDQAVRQFRIDVSTYPFQTDMSDADTNAAKLTNNLGFRLAWKPADDAERQAYIRRFRADIEAINKAFYFQDGASTGIGMPTGDGTHAFRIPGPSSVKMCNMMLNPGSLSAATPTSSWIPAASMDWHGHENWRFNTGKVACRLMSEWTCLRYISGQFDATATGDALTLEAPQGIDPADPADKARYPKEDERYVTWTYGTGIYKYVPYNRHGALGNDTRGPVLSASSSIPDLETGAMHPPVQGWRGEYLADALRQRDASDSPGELDVDRKAILDAWGNPLIYVCMATPGVSGYSAQGGSHIDENRYGMQPGQRVVTASLNSDIRTTAALPYVREFELWSAGPDGKFDIMRNGTSNRDNVAILGYNKGLE